MERKHFSRLYFLLTAGVSMVGLALRLVCMLTQYDAAIGYFDRGFLSYASYGMYFVAVIAAIVGAILLPKDSVDPTLRTPHRAPFAHAVGLALAVFAILYGASALLSSPARLEIMDLALIVSALAAIVYFPLTAQRHGTYRDSLVFAGFLPLLWCMAAIAITYADPYVTMNSPIKVSLQMGLLGFMLILLAELGCRLGKPVSRKVIAMTAIGTYTALMASLPILAAASVSPALLYTLCAGVLLAVAVYGGYMLFCYACTSAKETCTAETPDAPTSDAPTTDAPTTDVPTDAPLSDPNA